MLLLILWQTTEAFAQNLGTLHDVDKGMGVDMVENRTQLNHIGAVQCDIEHLALSALVQARASDERTAALNVVDDVIAHSFGLIGNDEHGLVGLHTIDHEVDDFALDEDDNNRVDGQADVTEGNKGAQRDDAIDNHDESAKGNLGVLVQNHRDDVRAATSRARAENQTDGHTIDDTGNDSIEEVVGMEPAAVVGNLNHRLDHRRVNSCRDTSIMDNGVIAPPTLEHKGEQENQRRRYDGLDAELGTQNPCADDEQGDIHADGV